MERNNNADSVGPLNLSGTSAMTSNGEFWVRNGNGTGTVNLSGGTISLRVRGALAMTGRPRQRSKS